MKKKLFILLLFFSITGIIMHHRKTALLKCPEPIRIPDFDPSLYTGKWHEIAYKDIAQFQICKCFKINFDAISTNRFDFNYSALCPGRKGYAEYPVHSIVEVDPAMPNVLREKVAGLEFNNNIVKVYQKNGIYDRAIQFQCKQFMGLIVYIGFNLVSRSPAFNAAEYDEMLKDIEKLGLSKYEGTKDDLKRVDHGNCAPGQPFP